MAYKQIADYGVIGNHATVALIGKDASVDWLCLPYMDSPSIFAALLDDDNGGRFSVAPVASWDSVQTYLPGTNILCTRFRTAAGECEVIDFMPVAGGQRLLRRLRGLSGHVRLRIECTPRPDYARLVPQWERRAPHGWLVSAAEYTLAIVSHPPLSWEDETAPLELAAGETAWLSLSEATELPPVDVAQLEEVFASTRSHWQAWLARGRVGKYPTHGFWQEPLDRSALVLKLLQFEATGAIAAAATTSLPAIIHGTRNWDYRFSWLRDSSMTLHALAELGHLEEVAHYIGWVDAICRRYPVETLGVVYRLSSLAPPEDEVQLDHLEGYKGSVPVRVGQFVIHQQQHDVYGEVLDALFAASRFIGKVDAARWETIARLVSHVGTLWRDPDHGIWEARAAPRHYTHSKLMCWVALDRGIKIAGHYGLPAPLESWRAEREAVRADILAHGYNAARGCFTQHYATEAVDAALLRIPLVGFLPVDDPRVAGTIAVIEQELREGDLILRYRTGDGLPGQEGGFLICLFWYIDCLVKQRRFGEVEEHLRRMGAYANHLGLFGEQYDPLYQETTGNFPQAFSHIGYAIAAVNYLQAMRPSEPPRRLALAEKLRLLLWPRLLNAGEAEAATDEDPAARIKRAMNILRGLFYDGHRQRVDYDGIRASDYYGVFQDAARALADFDPARLASDAERIAFWTNVFNAFVIHGVTELGVRVSVREVPLFFSRIQYCIGGRLYTPDDIEHGILRGNVRPPHRLRRRFSRADPRAALAVRTPDPRIHFALVCASRTCPPIEAYEAARLDDQLETSARVFLNATTRVDRREGRLEVSEIFRWYRRDFPPDSEGLMRYIANYLYDPATADWVRANATVLRVHHCAYDWRLNR